MLLHSAEELDRITQRVAIQLSRLPPVQRTMVLEQLLDREVRAKGPVVGADQTARTFAAAIRRDGVM